MYSYYLRMFKFFTCVQILSDASSTFSSAPSPAFFFLDFLEQRNQRNTHKSQASLRQSLKLGTQFLSITKFEILWVEHTEHRASFFHSPVPFQSDMQYTCHTWREGQSKLGRLKFLLLWASGVSTAGSITSFSIA